MKARRASSRILALRFEVDAASVLWVAGAAFLVTGTGCSKRAPPEAHAQDTPALSSGAASTATVPPVALSGVAPVSDFADASPFDGQTPYEQARAYEASGQYWHARLLIEKQALGPSATPQEVELLARICHAQGEPACVAECEKKLGRKIKLDAGAPRRVDPGALRKDAEKETDFTRARAHLLAGRGKEARAILEPKVIDNKASKEELRLLRTVCKEEGDRMCVALCDAKIK